MERKMSGGEFSDEEMFGELVRMGRKCPRMKLSERKVRGEIHGSPCRFTSLYL